MIEISWGQISTVIKSLFDPHDPAGLRSMAVLEGIRPGKIFADSPYDPQWAIVWESTFGALYLGGDVSIPVFYELIEELRKVKVVYLGLWPEDPRWKVIHPEFDHEGWVLDFYDRVQDGRLKNFIDDLPNGTCFRAVDKSLIDRSVNRDLHLSGYPNPEKALDDLVGVFLMRGNEILCEAIAGAEIMGTREIGTDTPEPYRQQGYATNTCARLI